ncbi:MAG: hypothetical protein WCK42_09920 [Myxococcaceae bacterium]
MADIGNVTGLLVRPNSDMSLADVEHQSKPLIQGALPASLAPLSTPEQFRTIGTSFGSSDNLRLAPHGQLKSAHAQTVHLAQVFKRLQASSEGHPFAEKEQEIHDVLKPVYEGLRSILARLTWKN